MYDDGRRYITYIRTLLLVFGHCRVTDRPSKVSVVNGVSLILDKVDLKRTPTPPPFCLHMGGDTTNNDWQLARLFQPGRIWLVRSH